MQFTSEHAFRCRVRIAGTMLVADMFLQVQLYGIAYRIQVLDGETAVIEGQDSDLAYSLVEALIPYNSDLKPGDVVFETSMSAEVENAGGRESVCVRLQYCYDYIDKVGFDASIRVRAEQEVGQSPWLREAVQQIPGLICCGTCAYGRVHAGGGQEDLFQHFCFRDVGGYDASTMAYLDPEEW
jgi:hypothetical protein